jgi:CRP-like cAMP-binding protein
MLLRPEFFPPGSIILSQDEPGDEIVFITHGRARLVSEKEEEVSDSDRYFEQGDYFGDLSFFLKEHRNSSAVAETYVEAFLLNRSLFNNLIKQDPRLRTIIQTMASGQSERNQNLLLAGIIL